MYNKLLKSAVPIQLGLAYLDKETPQQQPVINIGMALNFTNSVSILQRVSEIINMLKNEFQKHATDEHTALLSDSEKGEAFTYQKYLTLAKHATTVQREMVQHENQSYINRGGFSSMVDNRSDELKEFADHYDSVDNTADERGYLEYLRMKSGDIIEELEKLTIEACIEEKDRKRHTYIVGASGSGKSELLTIMVMEYLKPENEVASVLIDPHHDLAEQIARTKGIQDKLVYLAPMDDKGVTFRINPLQAPKDSTESEREGIVSHITSAFEELLGGGVGGSLTLNMGVILTPCLLVLMDAGNKTLVDLKQFFNDDTNKELVKLGQASNRPWISDFFTNDFNQKHYKPTKASLNTKLASLLQHTAFRNVVNGRNTVDLEALIAKNKTILVSVPKGGNADVTEALGRLIIASIKGIAMRRFDKGHDERKPIHLFIDECQNFIGKSMEVILTEARKYGLHLTLAQQILGQNMSTELEDIVTKNTHIKISGRTPNDPKLERIMGVKKELIDSLDTGYFYCKLGNKPPIQVQAHSHLVRNRKTMALDDDAFDVFLQKQIKSYYTTTETAEAQKKNTRKVISIDDK